MSGATFQICKNAGPYTGANPCQVAGTATSSSGTDFGAACVGSLPSGTGTDYYVRETGTGSTAFTGDPDIEKVTLTGNSTCASPGSTVRFDNIPLTTITVSTSSLAGTGVTSSTVKCADEASASSADGAGHTTGSLPPNTYTCTITIDP
jgi:hypothetical protein